MTAALEVEWLGEVPYAAGLELQRKALEACQSGSAGDRLMLLEHPPVITLGRSARAENVLWSREALDAHGVEVHEVARGGDVTYHAPGQLVGYPILDLARRGECDAHRYLRRLEQMLIDALAALGIDAIRRDAMTGVFTGEGRKIASIGVGLKRWVTCHGFALNVSIDLGGFEAIVPCGLQHVEMTSLARERTKSRERTAEGAPVDRRALDPEARDAVTEAFVRHFG